MLNAIKILTNVASVNSFTVADSAQLYSGNTVNLFIFRLWQGDVADRYVPASGATMSVKFPRSNSLGSAFAANPGTDQSQTLAATNPYAGDTSIWQISLTSTQTGLIASGGVIVNLVEGSNTTSFYVKDVVVKVMAQGY